MKKLKLLICAGAMLPLLLATSCKSVCASSDEKNFVEISKTDNRYLALKDGSTYIPIGLNFCWPPNAWDSNDEQKTLDEIERQLDNLAKNGGNFVRIWISADFTEPEIAEGIYDENKAKRLDKIVDMCAKRGIKAKMCLHHFTRLSGGTPSHGVANKHYTRKFYDKKFGGSFADNASGVPPQTTKLIPVNALKTSVRSTVTLGASKCFHKGGFANDTGRTAYLAYACGLGRL